jgi:hypothetical protein
LWIDGDPGLSGLAARLRQARNGVFGAAYAPVLMAVGIDAGQAAMTPRDRAEARAEIVAFLDGQEDLNTRAVTLARTAAQ